GDRRTRIRVLALPYRSLVVHHGRELRPEGCGRVHPHSGPAGTLAGAAEEEKIAADGGDREVKMWSGRFRQPLDPHFEEWQRSFPFDQKLLRYELAASRAHAQALKAAGIIVPAEYSQIASALEQISKSAELEPDYFNDPEAEDVHHFVEK